MLATYAIFVWEQNVPHHLRPLLSGGEQNVLRRKWVGNMLHIKNRQRSRVGGTALSKANSLSCSRDKFALLKSIVTLAYGAATHWEERFIRSLHLGNTVTIKI